MEEWNCTTDANESNGQLKPSKKNARDIQGISQGVFLEYPAHRNQAKQGN
ncbi:protein of unknown function (plasmid) [Caballeronia sp. S22]